MKRRTIAGLSLATALLLCGCASTPQEDTSSAPLSTTENTETQADSGDVSLTLWTAEEDQELIQVICDNFIKEHAGEANITIEWASMPESECRTNLLSDVLNGPDVYATTDGEIRILAAGGAASPVVNAAEISAANLPASVEALTYNGTLYGYPLTADNGYFLYYNKAYLSEEDVKSLDSILAVAEANGKKFAMDWTSGWYLNSFFGQTGLKVGLNNDGVTNFCDWNSTTNSIKGVDVAEALLAISSHPGFESIPSWIPGIESGEIIACVSGVWDEATIKAAWGDDLGATILPSYTCAGQQVQMSSYFGYKMIGVNPYSEHLEWAHKLAEYISNQENQELRFQMRGQGPSNLKAAESPEIQSATAIQAVIAQSEYSELQRLGTNYWGASTEFGNTLAAGNPEGIDLQELMDSVVSKITSSTVQ